MKPMRRTSLLVSVFIACLASPVLLQAEDASVDTLIDRLSADDPTVREEATRELVARGEAAGPRLRERLADAEPETAARIREALRGIEIERLRKTEFVRERDIRLRGGAIQCAAWSRDGKRFATAGETGEILVWDAATKKPVATMQSPDDRVYALAFSADGKRLWMANADPIVWDIETQKALRTYEDDDSIATSVAVSPDGSRVAFAGVSSPVVILDEKSLEVLKTIPVPRGVENGKVAAFRPDGRLLALLPGRGGNVSIVDLEKGEFLPAGDPVDRRVQGIAWRADGKLVICSSNGEVWIGSEKRSLGRKGQWASVSPDGRRFATGGWGDGITFYDEEFKELGTWATDVDLNAVTCWRFDGTGLLCGINRGLGLWLGELFEPLLDAHASSPDGIQFSPDGCWLCATSSGEGQFLNVITGEKNSCPRGVDVYPGTEGSTFVLAMEDTVELWDAAEGKSVRVLAKKSGSLGELFALSPDGRRLVSGGARGLTLDTMEGKALKRLESPENLYLEGAAWTPDSRLLVIFGDLMRSEPRSSLALVFDATGKLVHRREEGERFCQASWAPDGKFLWWISGNAILKLNSDDWTESATLAIGASWWQPVDDQVALARVKGVCGLWHIPTGTCLREFPETIGLFREAFSFEGRRLALAGDKGVAVWRIGK